MIMSELIDSLKLTPGDVTQLIHKSVCFSNFVGGILFAYTFSLSVHTWQHLFYSTSISTCHFQSCMHFAGQSRSLQVTSADRTGLTPLPADERLHHQGAELVCLVCAWRWWKGILSLPSLSNESLIIIYRTVD